MNKNPIGIIDSGIGGLSITSTIINKLPKESIIYLADSKNCPYGDKSNTEIYNLSKKMINFLVSQKIKLLIIACNTITVTSVDKLRKEYPNLPIVGIVPVIKTAVKKSKNKKIGVFSTKVTAKSKYQKDLINKFAKGFEVLNIGSSELVPLIESSDFEKLPINNRWLHAEHFANTISRCGRTRQHHKHHRGHDHREHDLHHVLLKCHQLPHLDLAAVHTDAAEPNNRNGR